MFNPLEHMPDTYKGIILVVSGTILLLHTMGILERWLNIFIIIGSLIMIGYGAFILARRGMFKKYYQKMLDTIKKEKK